MRWRILIAFALGWLVGSVPFWLARDTAEAEPEVAEAPATEPAATPSVALAPEPSSEAPPPEPRVVRAPPRPAPPPVAAARAPAMPAAAVPGRALLANLRHQHHLLVDMDFVQQVIPVTNLLDEELRDHYDLAGDEVVSRVGYNPVSDPRAFEQAMAAPPGRPVPLSITLVTPQGDERQIQLILDPTH